MGWRVREGRESIASFFLVFDGKDADVIFQSFVKYDVARGSKGDEQFSMLRLQIVCRASCLGELKQNVRAFADGVQSFGSGPGILFGQKAVNYSESVNGPRCPDQT